jgi:hypothetical protein
MEPLSGTTTAAASAGILALLIASFGPLGADVALVVLSALAGATVGLTAMKTQSFWQSFRFIIIGILVSLVLAWALSGLIVSWVPALAGPYTPSMIAFILGFGSDKLPLIANSIISRFRGKVSGDEK